MGNVDYSGVMLAVGILLALVVLFIGRALVMWWIGTSEIIEQQKQTNALFKQYLEMQGMTVDKVPPPSTVAQQAPPKQTKSPYSLTNQ